MLDGSMFSFVRFKLLIKWELQKRKKTQKYSSCSWFFFEEQAEQSLGCSTWKQSDPCFRAVGSKKPMTCAFTYGEISPPYSFLLLLRPPPHFQLWLYGLNLSLWGPNTNPKGSDSSLKAQTQASKFKSQPNYSRDSQIPAMRFISQPWNSNLRPLVQIPALKLKSQSQGSIPSLVVQTPYSIECSKIPHASVAFTPWHICFYFGTSLQQIELATSG